MGPDLIPPLSSIVCYHNIPVPSYLPSSPLQVQALSIALQSNHPPPQMALVHRYLKFTSRFQSSKAAIGGKGTAVQTFICADSKGIRSSCQTVIPRRVERWMERFSLRKRTALVLHHRTVPRGASFFESHFYEMGPDDCSMQKSIWSE